MVDSPAMNTWTVSKIKACKGQQKIVCLTAADWLTARLLDEAGIQLILVGDSLAMTVLGYDTTLPVTIEEMLHHTKAVARGVKEALVVADMPFLSYQVSEKDAIRNAGRFMKEAHAGAVKIEGGAFRVAVVKALVQNGIPVLGHIGLTPQSINAVGGYKVQGRTSAQVQRLVADARALEKAGVFAIVLECMPAPVAKRITRSVLIPTIGIGAGPHCDGQILVTHDLLGLFGKVMPKFVKTYASLGAQMRKAFLAYKRDVDKGVFPGPEHCY